jgi:hypothetical protein
MLQTIDVYTQLTTWTTKKITEALMLKTACFKKTRSYWLDWIPHL